MGYSFMDVKGYSRNLKGSLFRFFPALWHCFYEIKVAGWDIAVNGNFACDVTISKCHIWHKFWGHHT